MLTQMCINRLKLPQEIRHIIKDHTFYRMDSDEGIVIQNTKILKTCIRRDISNATSRANPSTSINTHMNIHNSLTSEYWEFMGDMFIKPRHLRYYPVYLSAINCDICGNYRSTNMMEIHPRSSISQKRIICECKCENYVMEDEEEYQEYLNDRYYDF
jgi:hypothetical protein